MRGTTLAFAAVTVFSVLTYAHNVSEWYARSIYQVMTDRFALDDGLTTAPCNASEALYCNGTWQGLINKLDYIADMGFTAIQISPVVQNIQGDTSVGEAYHGYWSVDLNSVNDHFGNTDGLKQLVSEVHSRGIYTQFDPFNSPDYFHPYCNVTDWTNATNYQDCWLYPYGVALADLDTDSSKVVTIFQSWVESFVANCSIDGIRIDAAKHVDDAFLPAFTGAANVFAMGEVLTGVVGDMCRYQSLGLLQGMENYLEYYPLISSFNGGSMWDLASMRASASAAGACSDTLALVHFAENHDNPRFAAYNEDMALAKNAMTYVMLGDGIPLIYQGQEQHFNGGSTPLNREALWTSGYNTSAPLYMLATTLNKARNLAVNMSSAYASTQGNLVYVDDNHMCLAKGPEGSQIMFCINNLSSTGPAYSLSVGGFEGLDNVVEVLSCTISTADATGNVTMYMGAGEPKVYMLASALNGTGLCSNTTVAKPAAGSNQSAASGLVIETTAVLAVTLGWVTVFLT